LEKNNHQQKMPRYSGFPSRNPKARQTSTYVFWWKNSSS